MRGHCLCGGVRFEIGGEIPRLYQCHCSLCRRVSGSAANAAMIVGHEQLEWVAGEALIERYATSTGWKSHFCRRCGSPVPNPARGDTAWWVPVGLLEDSAELELGAHLFIASKASWDRVAGAGAHFDAMPEAEELDRLLRRDPV